MRNSAASHPVQYSLNPNGTFVIENYNQAPAFSSFFPGIAGLWGIPMWVFYVNRGQGICSFGIESKDKSILEFQPASKAYRLTSSEGFRTFLKIRKDAQAIFHEPFRDQGHRTTTRMLLTSHDLTLEEVFPSLGLVTRVNYFTMPEEPYAALVRRLTLENVSKKKYDIELVDGLPVIIPYGASDWLLKNMSRTLEAWVEVENLNKRVPYYHLKVEVNDRPTTTRIHEGNFYLGFDATASPGKLLEPVVETSCIFGSGDDFSSPQGFLKQKRFTPPTRQKTANRMPSAMVFHHFVLGPQAKREITSLIGHAPGISWTHRIARQVLQKGFIEKKSEHNRAVISEIKNFALTNSSSQPLNQYSTQTFLDNVLRGGLPISFRTKEGEVIFNVFSRKHGDLERDYNFFVLKPTYFSQGNGNYRDINQNRRNDVWFNPHIKDQHLLSFINLLKADGYNPLILKGVNFWLEDRNVIETLLSECVREKNHDEIRALLIKGFQPGELLKKITRDPIPLKIKPQEFLERILGLCHKREIVEHGDGYWTDHWTYNLDLIESFLSLYPDELDNFLLQKKVFSFAFDSFYVWDRDHRYILTPHGVRQHHSVVDGRAEIPLKGGGHQLRIKQGEGPVYYTNALVKLLCLSATKIATLDPSGIGIEMEADKPNWYDALNGLPGLLGSSICETFELKRLCLFLLEALDRLGVEGAGKIQIFEELAGLIAGLNSLLAVQADPLSFWMKSNELKEDYRHRIRLGITGEETPISFAEIKRFLHLVLEKTNQAIRLAKDQEGFYKTYFIHEVTEYERIDRLLKKPPLHRLSVRPLKFKIQVLPIFLEGFVHALRLERNPEEAKKLYERVRKSLLYDRPLKMYRVNADLSASSEEIGRTRIFPRGWLENESIWIHMEYKFLLELLRAGLYEEFYREMPNVLIPFLNPQRYGRSILENSSFIVSSAHEDPTLHGRGFVARLSGSTAEFLHIWLLMNVGPHPFEGNHNKDLSLTFRPALAGWLFTQKETRVDYFNKRKGKWQKLNLPAKTYAFNWLGSIVVVYHNPKRLDTFGLRKAEIKRILLSYPDGRKPIGINGPSICAPYAQHIRAQDVHRIDIFLAA